MLPAFCDEQTPVVSCMLAYAGAMKETSTFADTPANVAVTIVLPVVRLEIYVVALPFPSVVIRFGERVAKAFDCVKLTVAPAMGVPRSFTVATTASLFPLAACDWFLTVIEIVVGVDESSGETCVLKVPVKVCLCPPWQVSAFALGHGIALKYIFPVTRAPNCIAFCDIDMLHTIAPPCSTSEGEHVPAVDCVTLEFSTIWG